MLLPPHCFELVGLCQQNGEITNHCSETSFVTELQMVPVKEISQKTDQLTLLLVLRKVTMPYVQQHPNSVDRSSDFLWRGGDCRTM